MGAPLGGFAAETGKVGPGRRAAQQMIICKRPLNLVDARVSAPERLSGGRPTPCLARHGSSPHKRFTCRTILSDARWYATPKKVIILPYEWRRL
jgi:hypothetical protein